MYKLDTTKRFDKALKLCKKRGYPIEDLRKAIAILAEKDACRKNTSHIFFTETTKANGRLI